MDRSGSRVSSPTDTELMIRVRDGDVRQLAHLFARHHVRLYNFYLRLTGDRESSEDMTQEVFFRILKYRHTFRGEGEFTAWMYHMARNVHLDSRRRIDAVADGEAEEIAAPDPHGHDLMERQEGADLVRAALARLPAEKREVILLSRYEGMRYDAIAELLGCSVDAVKVRVHRALNELRTIYFRLSGERTHG